MRVLFAPALALLATGCSEKLGFDDIHVNEAPTLSVTSSPVVEGETLVITTITADADGNKVQVTYSGWLSDEDTHGGGAGGETKTVEKATTCEDIGAHVVTVQASDGLKSVSQDVTVSILHTDTGPAFTSTPSTVAFVDVDYNYRVEVQGGNECDRIQVLFPGDGAPNGMRYLANEGLLTWRPGPADAGRTFDILLIAVDDADQEDRQTFQISVGNEAPTIDADSGPEEPHFRVGRPGGGTFTATDNDGQDVVWELVEGPEGMALDAGSGELRWTPTAAQVGVHTYRLLVKDTLDAASPAVERTAYVWKDEDNDGHCTEEVDEDEQPTTFCQAGFADCNDDVPEIFPDPDDDECSPNDDGVDNDCDDETDEGDDACE